MQTINAGYIVAKQVWSISFMLEFISVGLSHPLAELQRGRYSCYSSISRNKDVALNHRIHTSLFQYLISRLLRLRCTSVVVLTILRHWFDPYTSVTVSI